MKRSQVLREKIELISYRLDAATAAFWNHPRFAELYPESLVATHWVVRASVPLMEAGLSRAQAMAASDEISADIADYLSRHIPEETGHDDWVLEDLEALGFSRPYVLSRTPSPTAAALVGAQYYWIHHFHPIALLGYIAVLEGSPPPIEKLEEVVKKSGLPRRAFSTLFRHARLDPGHRNDLDRAFDGMPLTSQHMAWMSTSAIRTIDLLARVVEEVVELHELTPKIAERG